MIGDDGMEKLTSLERYTFVVACFERASRDERYLMGLFALGEILSQMKNSRPSP